MHMVPLGKERAPATSTTSFAAEDAAPAQHSRRRAGVIRQAQPEAPGHQLAASHAAAEKRKANKMTPTERKAKRAADQQRRRAAARFNIASEDTEKVSPASHLLRLSPPPPLTSSASSPPPPPHLGQMATEALRVRPR